MTKAVTLYLASASPRRREILDQLGLTYQVLPQDIDEAGLPGESPEELVRRLACAKAEAALAGLSSQEASAVLGSDTIVVCDGEIFGKPLNEADACRILQCLSGCTHEVLTAVALATGESTQVIVSRSAVSFRALSQQEISAYWASGEPADKAGAYGIQGLGALFVEKLQGSYSGIMGLPVFETATLLATVGLTATTILDSNK